MNKQKAYCSLLVMLAVAWLPTLNATAQAPVLYQLQITGTSWSTNNQGVIVSRSLNNRAILQDLARATSTSDFSRWGLAYHIGGNPLGDTIDVIDRNSGAVLTTVFGLYFGHDFGRSSVLSASHRQHKRLEYIYTTQNSHSLGSALLTDYNFFDANGNTNRTVVLGQMQWVVTPDANHRSQICSATFTTVRPWQFPR